VNSLQTSLLFPLQTCLSTSLSLSSLLTFSFLTLSFPHFLFFSPSNTSPRFNLQTITPTSSNGFPTTLIPRPSLVTPLLFMLFNCAMFHCKAFHHLHWRSHKLISLFIKQTLTPNLQVRVWTSGIHLSRIQRERSRFRRIQ
jgi:hypothetical protein